MADIKVRIEDGSPTDRSASRPLGRTGDDQMDLIELLFFAYRDFISDPDAILAQSGFGRAHHRVIHFVDRNPGLTVADLLDILRITKQSLARVLKQLIETGYITQEPGPEDRRQRLLYTTEAGAALASELSAPQMARIRRALAHLEASGSESVKMNGAMRDHIARFLYSMIDEQNQASAARLSRREDLT